MGDPNSPVIDVAATYPNAENSQAETAEEKEFIGAGILPMMPPGTVVVIERRSPRWAVGHVDTIQLRDDPTLTVAHLNDITRYHGGGTYKLRAQCKGRWVKGGTVDHVIDGKPLHKGNPHPNDPDRAQAMHQAPPMHQPHPYMPGGLASQPAPPPVPQGNSDMGRVLGWMMQQIQTLQHQQQQPPQHPYMGALPPGYQAPPGFQLVPAGYQNASGAFNDLKQLKEVISLVREIDGVDYEEEEEEDGQQTVDGVPMPQNLEEAASAYVWLKMKEHEQGQKQNNANAPTGPRLVRNGQVIAGPGATSQSAPPSPEAAKEGAAQGGAGGFQAALAALKSMPPEQQAAMYLQVTADITSNDAVAAEIQKQIQAHEAAKASGGAA